MLLLSKVKPVLHGYNSYGVAKQNTSYIGQIIKHNIKIYRTFGFWETNLRLCLEYGNDRSGNEFRRLIRMYNAAFCFTFMDGRIDHSVNNGGGPYTFRLNGQNLHKIGSLVPNDGMKGCFAQLYVHDTTNEVTNRIDAMSRDSGDTPLNENVVRSLIGMLDKHNVLVQSFRTARDRFQGSFPTELRLRLIGNRLTDGRQYNLPLCSEVAALIVGESDSGDLKRDIIVHHKRDGLQRIIQLHPSFMGLQYPLLFPYGEDYRLGIEHRDPQNGKVYKKYDVTMREYHAYRVQQRASEGQRILRGGRLFQQPLLCIQCF